MACPGNRRRILLKFRKMKNTYKYLFFLFGLTGIFNCFNKDKRIRNKAVRYILFTIVTICFITISSIELRMDILFMLGSTNVDKKSSFIYACTCIIYISFRIYLCKSLLTINKTVKLVCRMSSKLGNKFKAPLWIYIWIIVVLISPIFTVIQLTFEVYTYNDTINIVLFGYSNISLYLKFALSFAYSLCYVFFLCMPLTVFDLYYVLICLDISSLFIAFCKIMKASFKPEYRSLTYKYNDIIALKEFVDTKVGFLVFLSVLHNAFLMYHGIVLVINNSGDYFIFLTCMLNF